MPTLRAFLDRPPESYSRVGWLARTVVRNAQWSRSQGLRALAEEHEIDPVRRTVLAVRRARWRCRHAVTPGDATAVFLTGVPRSGTNMLTRALASLPDFEVHNEGDRRAFDRYRLRDDATVAWLTRRSRHRYILFKSLLDAHRIRDLLDHLDAGRPPRALYVFRDVDARTRSALEKFGPAAREALADIATGRGERHWHGQGLSMHSLAVIRAVDWSRASDADGAALVWYVRNRMFFELGLDSRNDVLPVHYNVLVADPEAITRAVCSFLDVAWDRQVAADIDRRSIGRACRFPIDPAIRDLCDGLTAELDDAAATALARWLPAVRTR